MTTTVTTPLQRLTDDQKQPFASVETTSVRAERAGHSARFRVDVELSFLTRPREGNVVISRVEGELLAPPCTVLGRLSAPATHCLQTLTDSRTSAVTLSAIVPMCQLDAVEANRNGSIDLQVQLWATTHRQIGVGRLGEMLFALPFPSQVVCNYRVAHSEWVEILGKAGFDRRVTVELRVPNGMQDPDWQAVATQMDVAQAHLRGCRWTDAIASVRHALDKVAAAARDQAALDAAVKQQKALAKGMDLDQRWLFVRHALRNVTHLAHHESETTGRHPNRQDAEAAINIALVLFARMRP